jgi:hypothetical protein
VILGVREGTVLAAAHERVAICRCPTYWDDGHDRLCVESELLPI